MGSVLECGEEAWDKIFDVNVKSALMLTQLCVPHMIDRNGGSIVYVTSIAGSSRSERKLAVSSGEGGC